MMNNNNKNYYPNSNPNQQQSWPIEQAAAVDPHQAYLMSINNMQSNQANQYQDNNQYQAGAPFVDNANLANLLMILQQNQNGGAQGGTQQPAFGQGFLQAAEILARTQQIHNTQQYGATDVAMGQPNPSQQISQTSVQTSRFDPQTSHHNMSFRGDGPNRTETTPNSYFSSVAAPMEFKGANSQENVMPDARNDYETNENPNPTRASRQFGKDLNNRAVEEKADFKKNINRNKENKENSGTEGARKRYEEAMKEERAKKVQQKEQTKVNNWVQPEGRNQQPLRSSQNWNNHSYRENKEEPHSGKGNRQNPVSSFDSQGQQVEPTLDKKRSSAAAAEIQTKQAEQSHRSQESNHRDEPKKKTEEDTQTLKNPIDDIPIPVANKGPKTFEQMLEEELAKEAGAKGLQELPTPPNENSDVKKQFLKRKNDQKSASKNQTSTTKKSYRYYVDNFQKSMGIKPSENAKPQSGRNSNVTPGSASHGRSLNSARGRKDNPEALEKERQRRPLYADSQAKARLMFSDDKRGSISEKRGSVSKKPETSIRNKFNLDKVDEISKSTVQDPEIVKKQDIPKTKQPFLQRGTGNAGGLGRDKSKAKSTERSVRTAQINHFEGGPARSKSSGVVKPAEEAELLVNYRKEQLEKQIAHYNNELSKLNTQRAQFEKQMKQFKLDQNLFEAQKKKDTQAVEKMKEEEMLKIRKEKRVLEQRQKNMQFKGAGGRKEIDTADMLRKRLRDANQSQAQMRQDNDILLEENTQLRDENAALKEEVAGLIVELREMGEQRYEDLGRIPGYDEDTPEDEGHEEQQEESDNAEQTYHHTEVSTSRGRQVLQSKRPSSGDASLMSQCNRTQIGSGISKFKRTSGSSGQYASLKSEVEQINNQMKKQIKTFAELKCTTNHQDDDEEFKNIEKQINNESKQTSHRESIKPLESTTQVFEKIEEQLREESPTKSAKNTVELELSRQVDMAPSEVSVAFEEWELQMPKQYHNDKHDNITVKNEIEGADGKVQRIYLNGKKEVIFSNKVRRETFTDGYTIVYFSNGDIKQTYPDQKIVYYFHEAKTTQTTLIDGLQVFKFQNKQIEKHFTDGTKEIVFPDGTVKCIHPTGEEESAFTDGTVQKIALDGTKTITYANGNQDVIGPDGRRERKHRGQGFR